MPRHTRPIILVVCLFLATVAAIGQSAPVAADTFSFAQTPNKNFGNQPSLSVQNGSTTYLQFNLAAIPTGVTVSKVTLRLFVDGVSSPGQFDLFAVDGPWTEAGLTYNNAPGLGASATGNHPVTVAASSNNEFLLVDVTSLVRSWLQGTAPNNGMALVLSPSTPAGYFTFNSKENAFTGHHPELEIALNGPQGPQGPAGPTGPAGPQGPAGNAALANKSCPSGSFATGFDSTGDLICAAGATAGPPPPLITAPAYVVVGMTGLVATVPQRIGFSYSCSITGGSIVSGASSSSGGNGTLLWTAGAVPGKGAISCTQSDGTNTSAPATSTFQILPVPTAPVITVQSSVAAGTQNVNASVFANPGSSYFWIISSGTITSVGGANGYPIGPYNAIAFTAGGAGTLTITVFETDGAGVNSPPGTVTVTVF